MCHLILLMPILGVPVFWLLPLNYAIPIYLSIVLISGFLYWLITKAMRRPLQDDFQSLIGTKAEVVSKTAPEHSARYLIRSKGELWSAYSTDALNVGELATIVSIKGIGVVVKREQKLKRKQNTSNPR